LRVLHNSFIIRQDNIIQLLHEKNNCELTKLP
jgi:hypothetical protein